MIVEQAPIQVLINAIEQNNQGLEEAVYRFLFLHRLRWSGEKEIWRAEVENVFPGVFVVLKKWGLLIRINTIQNRQGAEVDYLFGVWSRMIYKAIFIFKENAWVVVEGVRQLNNIAEEELVGELNRKYNVGYLKGLGQQYNIDDDAASICFGAAVLTFIEHIRAGKFTLPREDTNELNKNRVHKYFRTILIRKILEWIKINRPFYPIDDTRGGLDLDEEEEEDPIEQDELTLDWLSWEVNRLIQGLGEPCKTILNGTYCQNKTPGELVKQLDSSLLGNVDALKSKKNQCVNKLHVDIMNQIGSDRSNLDATMFELSRQVLGSFGEPCKTILYHALPPEDRSMEEIAAILQKNRPQEEVKDLVTPDQMKRRKYKCLQGFHDEFWKTLLQRKNKNDGTAL